MAGKKYTDAQLQEAMDAFHACNKNASDAAKDLNLNRNTFVSRLNEAKRRKFKSEAVHCAADALDADRKARQEKAEEHTQAALFKESEKQNEVLQKKIDLLMGLEESDRKRFTIPEYISEAGQGIFVGVASDWHLEEDVSPGSVPGYSNVYNPKIAKQRAEKYFQSYVFLLDAWRHIGKCDTAVLALLGDFITGYIHEELVESNHMSPSKAILFGQEIISSGIEYILTHGDLKTLILPCCYGNHGRTTLKSRIQTGADNSFEYLMYRSLSKEWRHEKRLQWHIAEGYHQNLDLFGHRIRFHHGDSIGFGGGIGGISIPVKKKIAGWNSGSPKAAHLDVFGHFHQLIDGGNFISNGSLIGYNSFALSIGASYERPRQAAFWIDAKRGKTMVSEIYVE